MSQLGTLLRGIRLTRQWTTDAMARAVGTDARHYELVETGSLFPPAFERRNWSRRLGFKSLVDFDDAWRDAWLPVRSASREGWVPVINKTPAGPPTDYAEYGIDSRMGFEYVPRSDQLQGEHLFGVVVIGDSMTPAYQEGDLVIFRPMVSDEPVDDGSAVFVRFGAALGHTCTFKSIHRRRDGKIDLLPENTRHKPMRVSPEEIDRMALAVERRPGFCHAPRHRRGVVDEYAQEFPE